MRSGRDCNKWELLLDSPGGVKIKAPLSKESRESRVPCDRRISLSAPDLFLAEVLAVGTDKSLMDEKEVLPSGKGKAGHVFPRGLLCGARRTARHLRLFSYGRK